MSTTSRDWRWYRPRCGAVEPSGARSATSVRVGSASTQSQAWPPTRSFSPCGLERSTAPQRGRYQVTAAILGIAFTVANAIAAASEGERTFQRCYACHSVVAGENKLPGPNLHGVFGRRAGTLPGFTFSPAMIAAGRERNLVWTRAMLEAYLSDPEGFVPGTLMGMPPLKDAAARKAVIDYLETQSAGPH